MHIPVKPPNPVRNRNLPPKRHRPTRMRAKVLIAKDSPVAQIEIEVVAALLDDWEGMESRVFQEQAK